MTKTEENRALQEQKRSEYMDGKLSHQDYYIWLSDFIGLSVWHVPFTRKQITDSKDEHLNDLPLAKWDARDPIVSLLAFRKGLPWSLSDTVCCLKARARQMVDKVTT